LVCTSEGITRSLPLEDVCSIVITSFNATVTSSLLIEAAKAGASLILCHNFKPVSVMLPANRSSDTLLTRAQFSLSPRHRAQLWQATIDAKCSNQLQAALNIGATGEQVAALRLAALGKKPFKEATCARHFWTIFARVLKDPEFRRRRGIAGTNELLNYGYAVLLSTVLQKLFAVGLDPTFGLSHATRERATPLAYDIMEPFRPCVDWRVFQWARRMRNDEGRMATVEGEAARPSPLAVTPEFRKWVTAFPLVRVEWGEMTLSVEGVIEGVVRGFRRAVLDHQPRLYRPWTPKNSKWAG
jgi:CRISPR-associated protein Cas1